MRFLPRPALAMSFVAALSCGGGELGVELLQRDSAGVEILESGGSPRATRGWRIEVTPVLDLTKSGQGPMHQFHRTVDAAMISGGSIAVASPTEIRFFAATGEFIGSVGRRGDGPGEFRQIESISKLAGDSVMAFDRRSQRISVFGPDLKMARAVSLRLDAPASTVIPIGRSAFVALVTPLTPLTGGEPGLVRVPNPVLRFSTTGENVDTILTAAGSETVRVFTARGVNLARPIFGKESHLQVRDGWLYSGSGDRMEYTISDANGRVKRIVRIPEYELRLSRAELDKELAARLQINSSPGMREFLAALPVPKEKPAYARLLVATDGTVWLAEHAGEYQNRLATTPRKWEVFDAVGVWLGAISTPERFTVLEIGEDYLLGVLLDSQDVEHPQLLRLMR